MVPNSIGLFNTLEHLDKHFSSLGEGIQLNNKEAGTNSFFIDQAKEEGYITQDPRGSDKYKITVKGLVLLNQMRLTKAIEKAEHSAKQISIIGIAISIIGLILSAVIYFNGIQF